MRARTSGVRRSLRGVRDADGWRCDLILPSKICHSDGCYIYNYLYIVVGLSYLYPLNEYLICQTKK